MRSKKEFTGCRRENGKPCHGRSGRMPQDQFTCRHCRQLVLTGEKFSGVRSRNHCPVCLHSRHLDLLEPGDRLSACKEVMEPLGLTCKRIDNKYGHSRGELMIIHCCRGCGKVSINRIARDDNEHRLMDCFIRSCFLTAGYKEWLFSQGIEILDEHDAGFVRSRLFGTFAPAVETASPSRQAGAVL